MEMINRQGVTASQQTLTSASGAQSTIVAAGTNLRGINLYTCYLESEDLPDSVAAILNATDPCTYCRAVRGGYAQLASPLFIPPGKALTFAYARTGSYFISYTVL